MALTEYVTNTVCLMLFNTLEKCTDAHIKLPLSTIYFYWCKIFCMSSSDILVTISKTKTIFITIS